jgi:hypothetical protein
MEAAMEQPWQLHLDGETNPFFHHLTLSVPKVFAIASIFSEEYNMIIKQYADHVFKITFN